MHVNTVAAVIAVAVVTTFAHVNTVAAVITVVVVTAATAAAVVTAARNCQEQFHQKGYYGQCEYFAKESQITSINIVSSQKKFHSY